MGKLTAEEVGKKIRARDALKARLLMADAEDEESFVDGLLLGVRMAARQDAVLEVMSIIADPEIQGPVSA